MKQDKIILALSLHRVAPQKSKLYLASLADKLYRVGKRYHKLCERACNEDMSEEYFDKRTKALVKQAQAILTDLDIPLPIVTQNDPRGPVMFFGVNEDIYQNSVIY